MENIKARPRSRAAAARLEGAEAAAPRGIVLQREPVPDEVLEEFTAAEEATAHNTRMDLMVCFNYGGRAELEDAAAKGSIPDNLYAPDLPDVDLLIRTSGEKRLSNFLLWQSAYAELLFTDTLWPDFDAAGFRGALDQYAGRERRFGGR